MARIAKAAGVSRQAVYLHFGTRGGMLMALVKRADQRFEIREGLFAAFGIADPAERLDASVGVWLDFVIRIQPVARDLIRLRETDPDAAGAWEDRMAELRSWLRVLVGSLDADGALAPGWTAQEATEYLWAASSVQMWGLLVRDCGWRDARAASALRTSIAKVLLREPSG